MCTRSTVDQSHLCGCTFCSPDALDEGIDCEVGMVSLKDMWWRHEYCCTVGRRLPKMLTTIVTACMWLGLAISEYETEINCLLTKRMEKVLVASSEVGSAGCKQTRELVHRGVSID